MHEGMDSSRARQLSRWMLGMIFMLLLGARVVLPCAIATTHGFQPRGGMCRENGLGRAPMTDTNKFFMAPIPDPTAPDISAALLIGTFVVVVARVLARPQRFPLAVSARGRPFASSDPPLLPYFAAQRDA